MPGAVGKTENVKDKTLEGVYCLLGKRYEYEIGHEVLR